MRKIAFCLLVLVLGLGFGSAQAQEVVFQSGEIAVITTGEKVISGEVY